MKPDFGFDLPYQFSVIGYSVSVTAYVSLSSKIYFLPRKAKLCLTHALPI